MAPPKGNKFWMTRGKHGRDAIFTLPEVLWDTACSYFKWADENPWYRYDVVKSGDRVGEVLSTPTQRPYSIAGFCVFLGVGTTWFSVFRLNCSEDFSTVINEIETVIRTQQWEGATVGTFRENIISRTLGLVDRTDMTTQGQAINTQNAELANLTEDELRSLSELQRKSRVGPTAANGLHAVHVPRIPG
jgi:DNA-packaging protein gp3